MIHAATESAPVGATLRTAALAAASRGWRVFPLRPGDKRPAVRDWEQRATTERARIERCWAAGEWNIGIATGPSGLLVVDLDTPKDDAAAPPEWRQPGIRAGADVLAVLAERHEAAFPLRTYAVRTPTGGEHLYFDAAQVPGLRNTAGRLGWLIDTRARGGYVVAAGSTVAGRRYELLDEAEPAPLPPWLAGLLTAEEPAAPPGQVDELLAVVRRRSGYAASALRGELDRVLAAPVGRRNHTLNAAAYALGQLTATGLLPNTLAADALSRAGAAIGLAPRECAATIRSGLAAGARNPRALPPDRHTQPTP